MAPHKCNFIVFSNDTSNARANNIDIKLFGAHINRSVNTTFLGIRFDKHLSFKIQISYLRDSCIKQMNILKIISNKNWGLSIKTLNNVYNSLIRSLLEYSSIIYPAFSNTNLTILERIQFSCLKIIHKKSKYESNLFIKTQPDFVTIRDRFDTLNKNYLSNCIRNKNELITELFNDYNQYNKSRELTRQTLICNYKNELETLQVEIESDQN